MIVTLAGPSLIGNGAGWWFRIAFGHTTAKVLLYLGIALLAGAWVGLGRSLSDLSPGDLRMVGAIWCVPLLAGAPLFSQDVYSYLAQGSILHLGASPYSHTPEFLARSGDAHLLAAVSPFWRHTTAPYGPAFLGLVSVIVSLTGSNLVVGVLLLRALELGGAVLLAIFVPRLARSLGADQRWALWLGAASPLVLLQLLAPAHNDALMAGLMVAGVALAVEGRPALGIVLCSLAATVKLPAALAIVFIAVAWARSSPDRAAALRALARSAAVAVVVVVVVSVVTGVGADWISTGVFSTPERVRLAITPATAAGRTVAGLLSGAGVAVNGRSLESAFATATFGLAVVAGLVVLWRTRSETMVRDLALLLLVFALAGPATWPWYLSWGLALVAACPGIQRWPALVFAVLASVFVVKPDGILALPLARAPVVLAVYAVAAAWVWYGWKRRAGGRPVGELPGGSSALAGS